MVAVMSVTMAIMQGNRGKTSGDFLCSAWPAFSYFGAQLLANIAGSTITYVHPDHLLPRLTTSTK
jgi:hypothetical protein